MPARRSVPILKSNRILSGNCSSSSKIFLAAMIRVSDSTYRSRSASNRSAAIVIFNSRYALALIFSISAR